MSSVLDIPLSELYSAPKEERKEIPTSLTGYLPIAAEVSGVGLVALSLTVPVVGWIAGIGFGCTVMGGTKMIYDSRTGPKIIKNKEIRKDIELTESLATHKITQEARKSSILANKEKIEIKKKTYNIFKAGTLTITALLINFISNSIFQSTCTMTPEGKACEATKYCFILSIGATIGSACLLIRTYLK